MAYNKDIPDTIGNNINENITTEKLNDSKKIIDIGNNNENIKDNISTNKKEEINFDDSEI